jgi:cytochrome c oxidase assembly factor CtaG/cytochrome c2
MAGTRNACGVAGLLALLVAVASPFHARGEERFAAHMTQHLLLIVVAAPLLACAAPGALLRRLPLRWRRAVGRWARLTRRPRALARTTGAAVVAWVAHVTVLWAWHVPALYEAALHRPWLHGLEHVSMLGTAWLFWVPVLGPRAGASLGPGGAALYLFAAAAQSTALGALLTFAQTALYPAHVAAALSPARAAGPAWALSPLEDQQLGGLLMWMPGGLVYAIVALGLLAARLQAAEPAVFPRSNATGRLVLLAALVVLGLSACEPGPPPVERKVVESEPERGRAAIRKYGCGGCHVIPGLPETRGRVGPSLVDLGHRPLLAGNLLNDPGNLAAWIRDPQAVDPGTFMPPLGVTEADARDIAAYLYAMTGDPPSFRERPPPGPARP